MKEFIYKGLQSALNRYLLLDPESHNRIKALSGKIVKIRFPQFSIALQFTDEKIIVLQDIPSEVDLVITGTPISLMRLALTDKKQFSHDDILIEGNLELGQQVLDIFEQLDIDWEEYLSRFIGDLPATQIGKIAKKIRNWNRNLQDTMTQNISEFVHEEIKLSPPREALQDFFADVDELRMDVDRMDARIKRLVEQAK